MSSTADVHDPCSSRCRFLCCIADLVHEQVGEQEGSDMVGAELQFDAFFGEAVLRDGHASVVDKDVYLIG